MSQRLTTIVVSDRLGRLESLDRLDKSDKSAILDRSNRLDR